MRKRTELKLGDFARKEGQICLSFISSRSKTASQRGNQHCPVSGKEEERSDSRLILLIKHYSFQLYLTLTEYAKETCLNSLLLNKYSKVRCDRSSERANSN